MTVEWFTYGGSRKAALNRVNVEDPMFDLQEGIVIVWFEDKYIEAVIIGHGMIRELIRRYQEDFAIQKHRMYHNLYVTWAEVPRDKIPGVCAYLTETLYPLIKEEEYDALQIDVNLPWDYSI
ncbi:MAG: hypothetical protein GF419_11330 [Ignavibacteriales bacterium]|jgi:hypothetical protein|nr:hypothetical protein [Ignavibacteriales bacterium]